MPDEKPSCKKNQVESSIKDSDFLGSSLKSDSSYQYSTNTEMNLDTDEEMEKKIAKKQTRLTRELKNLQEGVSFKTKTKRRGQKRSRWN